MQPLHRNFSTYQSHKPVKPPLRSRIPVRALTIVVFVLAIGMFTHNAFAGDKNGNVSPDGGVASATEGASDHKEETPKKTVDLAPLQPTLAATIKKYAAYDTSVSVIELNSGKLVQVGDSYPFVAASTTKILTALLYLNNVEDGKATLNEKTNGVTAQELLRKMVNESDNEAWTTLNNTLTKDKLAEYAKSQGLTSYDSSKNTITSNDMAQLLAKLYKGDLINEEHTKMLYAWMQNTSEERYIPKAIPGNVKLYHKAGYLSDRVHDVAIVDNGNTPYVIVIYSKTYGNAVYDFVAGQKLFTEITKQVSAVIQ